MMRRKSATSISAGTPSSTIATKNEDPKVSTSQVLPPRLSVDFGQSVPKTMLWVKEQPFLFGILSPSHCTKVGVNVLKKVADYCRQKTAVGDAGYYPLLHLEQWGHISKYKLQLPIDLAWAFFRVFHVLTKSIDITSNIRLKDSLDLKIEEIRVSRTDQKDLLVANTLQFIIFLYLQNFNRLHRKSLQQQTSTTVAEDQWPKHLSKQQKTLFQEQVHAEFLLTNLPDIIDLLCRVVSKSEDDGPEITAVPLCVLEELSFVLGTANMKQDGESKDTEFSSLVKFVRASSNELRETLGYCSKSETVDKLKFLRWVKENLKMNPWGPSSVPLPQYRLPHFSGTWDLKSQVEDKNKVFWNTQTYPKSWCLVSHVVNQVFWLSQFSSTLSSVKVTRCSNSFIYLPLPTVSVLVEKCTNITLVLGPSARFVKVSNSSNLKVSAVGRVIILQDVLNSSFNTLTPTQPIICGANGKGISLGPHNTFYPGLQEHMKIVGLGIKVQKWDRPLQLDSRGFPIHKQDPNAPKNHAIMRTCDFDTLLFPFTTLLGPAKFGAMDLSRTLVCPLPRNYAMKESLPDCRVDQLEREITLKNFTTAKKRELHFRIQKRFLCWLTETGNLEQLKALANVKRLTYSITSNTDEAKGSTTTPTFSSNNAKETNETDSGGDYNNNSTATTTEETSFLDSLNPTQIRFLIQ